MFVLLFKEMIATIVKPDQSSSRPTGSRTILPIQRAETESCRPDLSLEFQGLDWPDLREKVFQLFPDCLLWFGK